MAYTTEELGVAETSTASLFLASVVAPTADGRQSIKDSDQIGAESPFGGALRPPPPVAVAMLCLAARVVCVGHVR